MKGGNQEMLELGKFLRRRYQNLVGDYYSPNKVYIHSSNFDRTLISAKAVATGLFPPIGDEVSKPVPIHTVPLNQEKLLAWNIPCPRFNFLYEQYRTSPEYLAVIEKYKQKIEKWEQYSGKSLENLADVFFLHDTLFVENRVGLW